MSSFVAATMDFLQCPFKLRLYSQFVFFEWLNACKFWGLWELIDLHCHFISGPFLMTPVSIFKAHFLDVAFYSLRHFGRYKLHSKIWASTKLTKMIPSNTTPHIDCQNYRWQLIKKKRTDNDRGWRQMRSAAFQLQAPLCNHGVIGYSTQVLQMLTYLVDNQ